MSEYPFTDSQLVNKMLFLHCNHANKHTKKLWIYLSKWIICNWPSHLCKSYFRRRTFKFSIRLEKWVLLLLNLEDVKEFVYSCLWQHLPQQTSPLVHLHITNQLEKLPLLAPITWNGFHNVCPSLLKETGILYTALNSTEGKEGGIYMRERLAVFKSIQILGDMEVVG